MMTKDEILSISAGRNMRQALVDAGLWNANDERDPSKDISAAWEVVEEMQRKNYWFHCGVLSSYSYAIFIESSDHDTERVKVGINELPLAIGRAALLALFVMEII